MGIRFLRLDRFQLVSCALVGAAIVCGGCQGWRNWNPLGEGFSDEPKIGRRPDQLEPVYQDRGLWGVSEKSRQVERNLGIQ